MRARVMKEVAESLGAPPSLAPVLGSVLAPLANLGAMPQAVLRLLSTSRICRGSRVLELACGKGAVAIALASRSHCWVEGIDAYEPFIEAAQQAAARTRARALCHFKLGDVRDYGSGHGQFDVAIMLNLYPCERAAGILRTWVKPGGFYVLDDAFREEGPGVPRHFGSIPTREDCRRAIEQWGDKIKGEYVPTPSLVRRMSTRHVRLVTAACDEVAKSHPDLKGDLKKYIAGLTESARVLGGPVRPAVWLVRRGRARAGDAPSKVRR